MSDAHKPLRLKLFRVEGLFGEFNHEISLFQEEHITALIGPNGMGKTACLKLISGLFRNSWSIFQNTEFSKICYYFNDGSAVEVQKLGEDDAVTDLGDVLGIKFTVTDPAGTGPEVWVPRNTENGALRGRGIESYLPFLTRINNKTWVHDVTRQTFTLQEILDTYPDRLPESVSRSFAERPIGKLVRICDQIDCHLIETQRLLVIAPEDYRRAGIPQSSLAISRKAQILKDTIARELAIYASTSQSLDRSFPRRVLQQADILPTADLNDNLAKLDDIRRGLMEVGILDPEADTGLPPFAEINQAIAAVLNVYVSDTREKLDVLKKLKQRIQLFIELIDNRFNPKTVSVDKKSGFVVRRSSEIEVPLEKLSSGEQHQLVLFFELLFELKPNALILIDEPELSLHVAWQKQFIPDLVRIIELNKFDVLLATHSPQLIGEWDDVVVELGDVDPA